MQVPPAPLVRWFQRRLLAWYRVNGRRLPWRGTRNPYRILVSEVMLQQTQVGRVKDYYPRFLRRYPTFEDLAAAPEPATFTPRPALWWRNTAASCRPICRRSDVCPASAATRRERC